MAPAIDPGDHTVSELEEALAGIDDPEELDAILEAERDGDGRATAIEAIEARLDDVETAIADERASIQPVDEAEDVLTLAGPDEEYQLSERLLNNLSGIKSTLEEARQSGGQYEARLRKLENEVGDLVAYTDGLEAFLDENGTAQQVLDAVQDDLGAIEDDLDDVKPVVRSHAKSLRDHRMALNDLEEALDGQASTLDGVVDDVDSLDARFENFSEEVAETQEAHADRFEAVEDDLDDQAGRIDEVADEVDTVGDTVDDVAGDLRDFEETVDDRLAEAADELGAVADRVEANSDAIDDEAARAEQLAGDVGDLEQRVGDTDRVGERLAELEEELEEIQTWRNQLGSLLGGGGSQGD